MIRQEARRHRAVIASVLAALLAVSACTGGAGSADPSTAVTSPSLRV
ncbi:MAG: hypothetical protein INR67_11360, partial [Jatrophihabitans endophyticus]|nr:hypothetical protein [Jatrophihabitans endophyticus]